MVCEYARSPDPWVSLAAAAAVTGRIRLGAGVALVAQHHPINLAKVVASVDALSAGRTVLGVGFGWNREEMGDHGVDFATRQCEALLAGGAPGIHLYSLNRSHSCVKILGNLGLIPEE